MELATRATADTTKHGGTERLTDHQEGELGRGNPRILDHQFPPLGQPG
jgi:hypothetical protein